MCPISALAQEPSPQATTQAVSTLPLFATSAQVGPATGLAVDPSGRVFVVTSHRRAGRSLVDVGDTESRQKEDAALETTAQRGALLKKWLATGELRPELESAGDWIKAGEDYFTKASILVNLFEDKDGDGVAERQSTFDEATNEEMSGPGGGIAVLGNQIFFASTPSLWSLQDDGASGRPTKRTQLATGFGVRIGTANHGLGPIAIGPDRRIYFSCGDRGYNVQSQEDKRFCGPSTGAIFRMWPDGSKLELVASGFDHVTGLAFGPEGELFAADQRGVYLVSVGADFGHDVLKSQAGLQAEKAKEEAWISFYKKEAEERPSLSKIAGLPGNIAMGFLISQPSEPFQLLTAGKSGLQIYQVSQAESGGFKASPGAVIDATPAFDLAQLPSGDWLVLTQASDSPHHRQIALLSTARLNQPSKQLTASQALLKEGFRKEPKALIGLLSETDSRVRIEAMHALVAKGWETAAPLLQMIVVDAKATPRSRKQALRALAALAEAQPLVLDVAVPVLKDSDETLRALAVSVLGDARNHSGDEVLLTMVGDTAVIVKRALIEALGKLAPEGAGKAITQMVSKDPLPVLRAAAATAFESLPTSDLIAMSLPIDAIEAKRAHIRALSRRQRAEVAGYLLDSNPSLNADATKAIYDEGMTAVWPALSALLDRKDVLALPETAIRRALSAAWRLGRSDDAQRVAAVAARAETSEALRSFALECLEKWDAPTSWDRLTGRPMPITPRLTSVARLPLIQQLPQITKNVGDGPLKPLVAKLQQSVGTTPKSILQLVVGVDDSTLPEGLRLSYLKELEGKGAIEADNLDNACRNALATRQSPQLRAEARSIAMRRGDFFKGMMLFEEALTQGTSYDHAVAFRWLDRQRGEDGSKLLASLLSRYRDGSLPANFAADALELAQRRERSEGQAGKAWRDALELCRTKLQSTLDPIGPWRSTQTGGDASAGRMLFQTQAQCLECHALNGRGGDFGPDLAGVASRLTVEELLASVVTPSAKILPDHAQIAVQLHDGSRLSGKIRNDDGTRFTLLTSLGLVPLAKASIAAQTTALSPCPPQGSALTLRELRDLMAYLGTLR